MRDLRDDAYGWACRAAREAPGTPHWLVACVAFFLADPRAGSDALLSLADALDEVAAAAVMFGEITMAVRLRRLAEMPRHLAPARAAGGGT